MLMLMSKKKYQGKGVVSVMSLICLLGLSVFFTQAFAEVGENKRQSEKVYPTMLKQSLRLAEAKRARLVVPKSTSIVKNRFTAKNTSTTRRCKRQIRYRKICKTRHRTLRRCRLHEVNVRKCNKVPVQRKYCHVRINNVKRCRGPLGQQECRIVKQRRRICQVRTREVLRCKNSKKKIRRCQNIRKPVRTCQQKKYYIRRCKKI